MSLTKVSYSMIKGAVVNVLDFGADPSGVADSTQAIQEAIDSISAGVVYLPAGTYKTTGKISANKSAINIIGAGTDATYIRPTSAVTTTAIEINNGSWNDVTEVYASTGTSIGSSSIQDLTLSGQLTTSCTGVVFARATKQCHLTRVKVVGFSVGARMYGSWYAKVNHCTFESNDIGMYADYETNDFVLFECEFTDSVLGHLEFQGGGNCRKVTISAGSFDGMPSQWGAYFKTVQDLTIRDTYVEVYASPPTPTASFFLFGVNANSITVADNLFIAPSDTSYTGTFLDMGTGTGVGANYATITGNFQYQASACKFIDTTDATHVLIGNNQSNALSVIAIGEILPSYEETISFPALTGTTESRLTVCHVKKPFNIPRVTITFDTSASLGTAELRIIRQDTNAVVLNYVLGSVTANTPIDAGSMNGMSPGVALQAYLYKVGGSFTIPACSVTIEQV
jgi:hypothetical protein